MIRRFVILFAFLFAFIAIAPAVHAQDAAKCAGDPQMCSQIMELRHDLQVQKDASAKLATDQAVKTQQEAAAEAAKTAKMMGLAATIAVVLKILISVMKGWTSYFKSDQGVAAIKVGTLVLGFGAFVLTNVGAGVKWWQALIVAGGPPGAILVHELMDLVPVIQGKKKLSDVPEEEWKDSTGPAPHI